MEKEDKMQMDTESLKEELTNIYNFSIRQICYYYYNQKSLCEQEKLYPYAEMAEYTSYLKDNISSLNSEILKKLKEYLYNKDLFNNLKKYKPTNESSSTNDLKGEIFSFKNIIPSFRSDFLSNFSLVSIKFNNLVEKYRRELDQLGIRYDTNVDESMEISEPNTEVNDENESGEEQPLPPELPTSPSLSLHHHYHYHHHYHHQYHHYQNLILMQMKTQKI